MLMLSQNKSLSQYNLFEEKIHISRILMECCVTLTTLKYFGINHGNEKFSQFEIIKLALYASFECLSYGSMAIINICISFSAGADLKRLNLTSVDVRI